MTQQLTTETNDGVLVTCTHSSGEEDTTHPTGSRGSCTWKQRELSVSAEDTVRRMGYPLVPRERCA